MLAATRAAVIETENRSENVPMPELIDTENREEIVSIPESIDTENRPEFVLIPDSIETRARNKIEAVDRVRVRTADTEFPIPKSAESCSHSRSKRFLNPFQILGSVHDERLDMPRIPYVHSNYFSFNDADAEDDDDGESYNYWNRSLNWTSVDSHLFFVENWNTL